MTRMKRAAVTATSGKRGFAEEVNGDSAKKRGNGVEAVKICHHGAVQ